MSSTKFDNVDRNRVIKNVEDHYCVTLSKVGRRPKWLQDEAQINYWVIGGYGEWHGIPEEMMQAELKANDEGKLIVAIRKKASMDIFSGGVNPLVQNRRKLYRAKKTTGDYQFTYKVRGNHLIIDQLPTYSLEKIATLEYSNSKKEQDKNNEKAKKILKGMPPDEINKLLESLNQK